jgi:hypothetical protein
MRKSFFFSFFLAIGLWFFAAQPVFAVAVRTHGGVTPTRGNYTLRSENGGNGNLNPGSSVTVDSYLFQCKSSGTAACSTEHNSDATLVQKWQNMLTVPNLNASTAPVTHNFVSLPHGQCGRIQYDQGVVGINGAIGGWVYNFGVDCQNPQSPSPTTSCSSQQPINTQFKASNTNNWISGADTTNANFKVGQQVDVNCFAKNGSSLLEGGVIDLRLPNGQNFRISNTPELRNYALPATGLYTFTCSSTTINSCSDSDNFTIAAVATPQPSPQPSPTAGVTPTPQATPQPSPTSSSPQISTCDRLEVISGNDSLVPAKVTFRARGSDNKGSIQGYRFYFGDGERVDSTNAEITHEYKISGTFLARVDVKDSLGNYKTSNVCEDQVRVRAASIESHKSGCSDVFITADNGGKAPSLVKFIVTGYDNKGGIQDYRLDFGNGITKEGDGRTFEQRYDKQGTYEVKAFIKNSNGEWVGGADTCRRTMTIGSMQPLRRQPSTGTPTVLPVIGFGSGITGVILQLAQRRRSHYA